ncbi:SusC/RagA family TonB-linked outer membrane protein [uncultured Sunxiuqinia sp.]|uniref:SusC/RagA family TonB-linked outer membrane protein n=1 Tax=uncultured Sunxiuqinia sp. TaxID=1573825 RepID=UPI0026251F88|nr:SusC/RagA family TonB-linked outer membrane protein [uncultured Sunxiuqinia sp.]
MSIRLKKTSMGDVFELIQEQSDYIFFYKDDQVDLDAKVSVNAENQSIDYILNQVLSGTDLKYKIFDRQIIIIPRHESGDEGNIFMKIRVGTGRRTISGTVSDEDGIPIPGVSIIVKGKYFGTTTDDDGNYSFEIPEDCEHLVFHYIGMQTKEVPLGDRNELNVTLSSEVFGVNEVIVSALGIRRAEKSLTYAMQTISGEELTKSQEYNYVSLLSGKISGIEITKSAAGAGGSTKVILRGNKSLSTTSEPLFVIDGIPMANNKGRQMGMFGGKDGGDGLSQLNVDDIESISILKGANAAALYGSQGANGVVLVTTRSGQKGRSEVTFSTSCGVESILELPELQYKYGSSGGAKESWSYTPGSYDDDFVRDFFKPGINLINTVSASGGNGKSVVYFSLSNNNITGIIPENEYNRTNLTLKQSTSLLEGVLNFSSNVMLSNEIVKNKNVAGYYLNPLTGLYFFPRNLHYQDYAENYQIFNPVRNMYLQNWFVEDHFQSNPEWIIHNQRNDDQVRRGIVNAVLDFQFSPSLALQTRGSYDFAIRSHEQKNRAGSNGTNVHPNGSWEYEKFSDELVYVDAILSYHTEVGKFRLDAMFGGSYQQQKYGVGTSVNTGLDGLKYPNEFFYQNIADNVMVNSILQSSLIKEAVFGTLQLSYKEKIFVELLGRNDWASSLYGTGNDSYFYPSAGIAVLVNELVSLPEVISYAKLRSSYAMVANEVPFNSVSPNNTISPIGIEINTTKPFTNLKPEMIRSFEFGGDWRFLGGRFGIDLTYYNINSRDQFIALPAPYGSGYTEYFVNAGEVVNSGLEMSLNSEIIKRKNVGWLSRLNYSHNRNRIVALHPNLKNPISLSDNEGYQLIIQEGGSFGDLYVYKFQRDEQGRIMLDKNGNITKSGRKEYIGNSNPDWSLGWNNTINYKNLSFSFLFSGKFGGKVISQTEAMLDGYGVSKRTADARDNGGVAIDAVAYDGSVVTRMDPQKYYTYIGDRNGIKEAYTYNRTNIRLSQVNLSYAFDLTHSRLKRVAFSLTGQNLFFLYKDAPFDPEVTMNTKNTDQALDNFSLPITRTIGAAVKFTF